MTEKRIGKLLETVSPHLRRHYDGSGPRVYYDKEKYKRTAAADIKHAAQKEDKDPPSVKKDEN
jgi:hypothetical protein